MPLISWKDKYETHIETLDEQHKKLVKMINELHDSMKSGASVEVCHKILKEVVEYTDYHFKSEEKLFQKHNYPDAIRHKKEHDDLRAKAIEHLNNYKEKPLSSSLEVMIFLKEWLNHHILEVDMKYSSFLK